MTVVGGGGGDDDIGLPTPCRALWLEEQGVQGQV